ncbi:neutral ceramidase-like [Schistocerca gregaria]|uniref:neutral ceramidase-like n=1 Tax=Schistocerca gregaria TaxID=7010 RepID=UPI00211E315B|nr:neutral ceramidase-like [Schistocerca gregaria]
MFALLAVIILSASVACHSCLTTPDEQFLIGSGIYDITGPAADVTMMGYGRFFQKTSGISMRLYARAFVIAKEDRRVAFVSADLCFITQVVKEAVVEKLKKEYGSLYGENNVMLAATHTHSGPGGYSHHSLYQMSTLGFCKKNFDVIVDGIVESVRRAHDSLGPGTIAIQKGNVEGVNANRSPASYCANPESERAQYKDNVDKEMVFLKFTQLSEGSKGKEIGMISWFPVHGTSLNNTNTLISGDNKGYASYLMERDRNQGALPGKGPFVAAYAQCAEGDVTPNVKGAFCSNGEACDEITSACPWPSRPCRGVGPSEDQFENCRIIGYEQYLQAKRHYDSANNFLSGPVRYSHIWVDMENVTVPPEFSGVHSTVHTCRSALGDSFGAGTTDGAGIFNFVQGTNDTHTNAYWNWLFSKILDASPSEEDVSCHYPKPILLFTSKLTNPSKCTQNILPLQVFNIGQVWIAAVPAELTTMAGRRLSKSIFKALRDAGSINDRSTVIITCVANSYSHYVTTREEYSIQRYEGSSVLFGPFTLNAYQFLYYQLVYRLSKGLRPPRSASPEKPPYRTFPVIDYRLSDSVPQGLRFGSVHLDAKGSYRRGETVSVSFWSSHPSNNLRTDDTFLVVERLLENSTWSVQFNDACPETRYIWERVGIRYSLVTIEWDIPHDAPRGHLSDPAFWRH